MMELLRQAPPVQPRAPLLRRDIVSRRHDGDVGDAKP